MGFKHYEDKCTCGKLPCQEKRKGFRAYYAEASGCLVESGLCKDECNVCPLVGHLISTTTVDQ